MILIKDLLMALGRENVLSKKTQGNTYNHIEIFDRNSFIPFDHTLYITRASDVNGADLKNPNTGFFIIKDADRDHAGSGAENVIFTNDLELKQLFIKTRECAARLAVLEQCKADLVDAALRQEPLEKLLDIAAKFLENPIVLYDLSARPVATSNQKELLALNDPIITELIETGHVSTGTLQATPMNILNMLEQLKNSLEPQVWHKDEIRKIDHISYRVMSGNIMTAHLTLMLANGEFDIFKKKILVFLSDLLSIYLEKHTDLDALTPNSESILLMNLYDGNISPEDLVFITKNDKWRKSDRYMAICIKTFNNSDIEIMLSVISRLFRDSLPFFHAFVIDNKIIGIAGIDSLEQLACYFSSLNTILKNADLYAGCSIGFNNLSEFSRFAKQAEEILEIGRSHDATRRLYNLKDFYFPYLVRILAKTGNIKLLLIRQVLSVYQYDKENNTDIFNTTHTYLKCGCNAQKASDRMYLHRNTLMHRIDRFEELTHIKIEGEEQYRLLLSFEIITELHLQDVSEIELL